MWLLQNGSGSSGGAPQEEPCQTGPKCFILMFAYVCNGYTRVFKFFQVFCKCFKRTLQSFSCFGRTSEVFHLDVAKLDRVLHTYCNTREKRSRCEWSPREVWRRGWGRASSRVDVESRHAPGKRSASTAVLLCIGCMKFVLFSGDMLLSIPLQDLCCLQGYLMAGTYRLNESHILGT